MKQTYTFGNLRFVVWSTGKIETYTRLPFEPEWDYTNAQINPGFATFLRERAEVDYA